MAASSRAGVSFEMAFPTPASSPATSPVESLDEAFKWLQSSTDSIYRKGHVLYEPSDAATSLFYVLHGHIKVSRPVQKNKQVVVDIYAAGEFFGESALLGGCRSERATVMQGANVREWPALAIEECIIGHPRVGVALLQKLITRCGQFAARIEMMSTGKIPDRLARVLLGCAERLGTRMADGKVQLPPLTHALLSEWIGTSRELTTHFMNQLRREEYIQYSRREIVVSEAGLRARLYAGAAAPDHD